MLPFRRRTLLGSGLAALALTLACQKVPLLAPTGSTITLTATTNALSANGSIPIVAQVIEAAGTPPHSGTHVTFVTTLGQIQPSEAETDVNGQVSATFTAGGSNGTATITAISGGASTGATGGLKIFVGTAAVGRVSVNANPLTVPAAGGTSTVTALVLDINGNTLSGSPVQFTTTAGTLSTGVAVTNASGIASTVLTTSAQATVTASVGAQAPAQTTTPPTTTPPATPTTPSPSGQASGSVVINVQGAPSIAIKAPTTNIQKGVPATFVFTVTAATANASPIREVTVDWGDGVVQSLGSFTGDNSSSHAFTHDGSFLVKATVVDAAGNSNSASSSVVVIASAKPNISLTYATPVGRTVTFTIGVGSTSGTAIVSSSISYGDGSTDELGGGVITAATRTHTYGAAGTFNVVVSAVDVTGQVGTASTSVTVP
jgi:Big-like domain-containing protein/PKD domain-containing protein